MVYIETMRTLVLFTRSPEAEARAKGLPRKAGARLFRALLASWSRTARAAGVRLALVAPAGQVAELAALCPGAAVETQRGETFAERLEDAVERAFARGASPVVIAGGDAAAPHPIALARVFDQLAAGDRLVLGPSPDGGVNLIGLSRPAPALLAGVPWASAGVDLALRARAAALGLSLSLLPASIDVDRHADLVTVAALLGLGGPAVAPEAIAAPRPAFAAPLDARGPPQLASCC